MSNSNLVRERWATTLDPKIKRRLFATAGFNDIAANELLEQILDKALPPMPDHGMKVTEVVAV